MNMNGLYWLLAIGVRACWPFYLTLENGQLLSQKGIFCHQFRLTSATICQGLQRQGGNEWFRPTSKTSGEGIQAAILQPPELGKNTSIQETSPSRESSVIRP
jgi:hypothetical protein